MTTHEDKEMQAVRDALSRNVGDGPATAVLVRYYEPAPPVNFPGVTHADFTDIALLHKALSEGVTGVPDMDLSNPALHPQSLDPILWCADDGEDA